MSPRGDHIAALCLVPRDPSKPGPALHARLMLAETGGTKSAALAEGMFAPRICWSPDGSTVALSSLMAGAAGVSADDWLPLAVNVTGRRAALPRIGRGRDLQWGNDGTTYWISVQGLMSMDRLGKRRALVRFPFEWPG